MSRFRLREMRARNYRCFEELTLPIEDDTAVVFAENGGGKTALLAAPAMGVAVFQRATPQASRLSAARDMRSRTLDEKGRREPVGGCELVWTADLGESKGVTWVTEVGSGSGRIRKRHRPILEAIERVRVPGERWPLFAWYGVDRLSRQLERRRSLPESGRPRGAARPRQRAHGRGDPRSPRLGDRRRPAERPKTAARHPQSQSPRRSWRLAARRWTANGPRWVGASAKGRPRRRSGLPAPTVSSDAIGVLRS